MKTLTFNIRRRKLIVLSLLIVITALGGLIRFSPAFYWGIELNAYDPWIEYWLVKYVYEHGLGSWTTLTRDNPATHIFWYPWGRDFTRTEYPGVVYFTVLIYPIGRILGFSLKEWTAITPVIYGVLAIITAFFLGREIKGDMAGLATAAFIAFAPGAVERTVLGFVEKEGAGIPLIFLTLIFYLRMLKTKKMYYAVIAGLSATALAFTWGGFRALMVLITIHLLLLPIIKRIKLVDILNITILIGMPLGLASFSANYTFTTSVMGLATLTPIPLYLLHIYILKKPKRYVVFLSALIIVVGIAMGIGIIKIRVGRQLLALIPYEFRGLFKLAPLVESVAEHSPPSAAQVWHSLGIMLIMAILGILYSLYKAFADKDEGMLLASVIPAIILWGYRNMAYLATLAAACAAIAAGILVHALVKVFFTRRPRGVRRVIGGGPGLLTKIIAGILLLVTITGLVALAWDSYESYTALPAAILRAGINMRSKNEAWLKVLDYIRENTSKDAVIVSWWDYGYWISVNTGRATIADGATINGTQIEMLARTLTGSEEEARNIILNNFKAPINETYVLVYDVFIERPNKTMMPYVFEVAPGSRIFQTGLVDIAKSQWMFRIAGRNLNNYWKGVSLYGGGQLITPDWTKVVTNKTYEALIYKIMVHGIYTLGCNFTEPLLGTYVPKPVMKYFKPEVVIAKRITGDVYVIVFLYRLIR